MRSAWYVCLLLSGCVLAAGCVRSEHPLSDPEEAVVDSRIIGVWKTETDESTIWLHIGMEADRPIDDERGAPELGLMRYVAVSQRHEGTVDQPIVARFFSTLIPGDAYYANQVYPLDSVATTEPSGYWFARYLVDGDTLSVTFINTTAVKEAIGRGELTGSVGRSRLIQKVQLTEKGDALAEYLRTGGSEKLFPEEGKVIFTRVQ